MEEHIYINDRLDERNTCVHAGGGYSLEGINDGVFLSLVFYGPGSNIRSLEE